MAAVMSPIGVGVQFFNNSGVVLSGGQIFTYAAGTTTLTATYTDNTLGTPNANPIVLDSAGRYSSEIWWSGGTNFKFILKDASNNTIATWDNLVGINDVSAAAATEWTATGLTPTYVSATSFTLSGNQTSIITANLRLKSTNTGGTIYSTVTAVSYSAGTGLTTVTVVNDSGSLDSGLSAVSYGFLNSVHTSMPPYIDSSPILQNLADATKLLKISASGITTGTTRTLTAPDKNGTIATTADISTSGVNGTSRKVTASVTAAGTSATWTADEIVVETALGGSQLLLTSYSQACNLATTGAGGMDTGAAPASGFVSIYAIAKSDGTKNILACNVTTSSGSIYAGANMPAGYTYSALLSTWPTNGSNQFVVGYQYERTVYFVNTQALHNGVATTYTSISLSSLIPSNARRVLGNLGVTTAGASGVAAIASSTTGIAEFIAGGPANGNTINNFAASGSQFLVPIITSQTIYYKSSAAGTDVEVWVSGYTI